MPSKRSSKKHPDLLTALASRMTGDRIVEIVSPYWCEGDPAKHRHHVESLVTKAKIPPYPNWDSEGFELYRWRKPGGSPDKAQREHEMRALCCYVVLFLEWDEVGHPGALGDLLGSLLGFMPELLHHVPSLLDSLLEHRYPSNTELAAFIAVIRLLLTLRGIDQLPVGQRIEHVLKLEADRRDESLWTRNDEHFAGAKSRFLSGWYTVSDQLREKADSLDNEEHATLIRGICDRLDRMS